MTDTNTRKARGELIREAALQLTKDFPLGSYNQPTKINTEKFDYWMESQGLLEVPPEGISKDSDAWLGHLQRRHQCIGALNKAGGNKLRMNDANLKCYVIRPKNGMIWIRPSHEVIAQAELPKKIESVFQTKRKQLEYLMESADWSVLPVYERMFAEGLYDDIDTFEKHVTVSVEGITSKFNKLASKIKTSTENNEYQATNGGIKMMLASEEELSASKSEEEDDWHHPS